MKLIGFISLITLSISVVGQENNNLWYAKPAKVFEEALPIGNGRIGAWFMEVFSQTEFR